MRRTSIVPWAVLLIVTGVIGLAAMLLFGGPAKPADFSSNGQRIYYTGAGATGPIPRSVAGSGIMGGFGMMRDAVCVDCHGEDGRGGRVGMMFGAFEIPDIRYSELVSARSEDGTTVPAWTDSDIARAIRDGVEPDGESLKAPMPRYEMTDAEINDVIAYLKALDGR